MYSSLYPNLITEALNSGHATSQERDELNYAISMWAANERQITDADIAIVDCIIARSKDELAEYTVKIVPSDGDNAFRITATTGQNLGRTFLVKKTHYGFSRGNLTFRSLSAAAGGWVDDEATLLRNIHKMEITNTNAPLQKETPEMTAMTALADNLNLILTQDPYPSYTIFVGEGIGSPLSMTVEVEDGAASTIKLNTGTGDTETIALNPGIAFTAENLAEIMAPTFGVCQPANIRVLRVSHEAEINPYSVLPPLFRR